MSDEKNTFCKEQKYIYKGATFNKGLSKRGSKVFTHVFEHVGKNWGIKKNGKEIKRDS